MKTMTRPMLNVGKAVDGGAIRLDEQQHMALYGMTGGGKSYLFFLMLISLIVRGIGFCLIDGGGDLARRIAAWVKQNWEKIPPFVRRKIHWVEVSHTWNVSLDPFDVGGTGTEYIARLTTRIHKVMRDIVRGTDDFSLKDTPLVEKWLVNTLWACAVEYEPGKRMGLHKALDILGVEHPRWAESFLKLLPVLPDRVARDFYVLHGMNDHNRQWEKGGAERRLVRFLTPLVQSMFESQKPRLDIPKAIQEGGILLCDIAPTLDCSIEQSTTIGGLIQTEIMDAMETTASTDRKPFILAIDEAENYVGEDTGLYLARSRKWGGACWLGFQNLASLMTRMKGAVHKVLSQVQVHCTFQQRDPVDLEILKQVFGYPCLDFAPHMQPTSLPAGEEWVVVEDEGQSRTDTKSTNRGITQTDSETISQELSRGKTYGENWSHADSLGRSFGLSSDRREGRSFDDTFGTNESRTDGWSHTAGTTRGTSHGFSNSETEGWSENRGHTEGGASGISETEGNPRRTKSGGKNFSDSVSTGATGGTSFSDHHSSNQGESESDGVSGQLSSGTSNSHKDGRNFSESRGIRESWSREQSDSYGGSESESFTESEGRSRGRSQANSFGDGESRGLTESRNRRLVPLQRHRIFLWPSGKLKTTVQDQLDMVAHAMSTLDVSECILLNRRGGAQFMKVNHVHELGSPHWCAALVEKLKETIFAQHPCYFVPKVELKRWHNPGKKKSTGSNGRSTKTRGRRGNSFGPDSSPLDRLDSGHSNGSVNKEKPDAQDTSH